MFLVLLALTLALLVISVQDLNGSWDCLIGISCAFVVLMLLYACLAFKNPGVIKKSPGLSFMKLTKFFEPEYLCPTC